MPGPPTINWYRADLRSPLPWGLSRPADHLYQSLLFFFPSPLPILQSTKRKLWPIGRRLQRTAGRMAKPSELGGKLTGSVVLMTWPHSSRILREIYVCVSDRYTCYQFVCLCGWAFWVLIKGFLCCLFLPTSSAFRGRSSSSLAPFVHQKLVG